VDTSCYSNVFRAEFLRNLEDTLCGCGCDATKSS
jgi:hypothetical protein